MDKISVKDISLQNTYVLLQQMSDSSNTITEKCVSDLNSLLSNLDVGLRKDIQNHIEEIIKLKEKLKHCIDENMNAISDRIKNVQDYEKQTYKKRNII